MLSIIDIDQTLSTGFIGASFKESIDYYRTRGIAIPATVTTYLSLFQLPEVLQIHDALPGAVEGVQRLSQLGTLHYFTVRKDDNSATSKCIQAVTRRWLAEKHFPCPDNVVFCRSTMHKLVMMHELGEAPIVFIDDRWQKALEALDQLETRNEEARQIAAFIRKHVTIIAFGARSVPHRDIRLVALPTWEHIADVMAMLNIAQVG